MGAYWAASDTATMIGRSVRRSVRNVDSLLMAVALPVPLMLMFVYVFGGALDPGGNYVDYVVPGIILLCTGYGAALTALDIAGDVRGRRGSLPVTADRE